jgi:hypothetical protein
LTWKEHTKKVSELRKANTDIDMKVRSRLEELTEEMLDADLAISLEFLKDHLHLNKDDNDAIQELKLHIELMQGVSYGVIVDDSDQSIYVFFKKAE